MELLISTVVIFVLLVYIIYLHFQISKKQSIIESIVNKIIHFDRNKHKDDLIKLIDELKIYNLTNTVSRNKFLGEDIMQFIFDDENESELFIHYTREEEIAKKILMEGLKFYHSLYKTSEKVHNDEIDLTFKHHQHKGYGNYVIVISIAKTIYDYYKNEINSITRFVSVEQVLMEIPQYINEDNETIYTLSSSFIKGYFNYETGEIVKNPSFNAKYDSPKFRENVVKYLNEHLKGKPLKKS